MVHKLFIAPLLAVMLVLGAASLQVGEIHVTPAADASVSAPTVDSPTTICNRWRPHGTADTVDYAVTYYLDGGGRYIKTQCHATDLAGGNHFYCVTTWWNGVESWTHPCLDGY
jgi:hypothetical protein